MSVATVVQIRGDGMAPTMLDGDHVVLLRGSASVARGDVVVYDPTPPARPPEDERASEELDAAGRRDPAGPADPGRPARSRLRNTAVVDADELAESWARVQRRSGAAAGEPASRSLRVGRVLAVPGDLVTFHDPGSALEISVNGARVVSKRADTLRLALRSTGGRVRNRDDHPASDPAPEATLAARATAWETLDGGRRYRVLLPDETTVTPDWAPLELPPRSAGPVELEAPGYLVLADNRDEGACCDSRALGWIAAERIRGEVLARLPGNNAASPDLAPEARGFAWAP
jgi:signal peptidase I